MKVQSRPLFVPSVVKCTDGSDELLFLTEDPGRRRFRTCSGRVTVLLTSVDLEISVPLESSSTKDPKTSDSKSRLVSSTLIFRLVVFYTVHMEGPGSKRVEKVLL